MAIDDQDNTLLLDYKRFSIKQLIWGAVGLIVITYIIYRVLFNAQLMYGVDVVLSHLHRSSQWLFVLRLFIEIMILFNWRYVVSACRKLFSMSNRAVYVLLQSRRYVRMVVIAELIIIASKLVRAGLLP